MWAILAPKRKRDDNMVDAIVLNALPDTQGESRAAATSIRAVKDY